MQATMQQDRATSGAFDWQQMLRYGILTSIVVAYTCLVGMVESFNDVEVIRDTITLGQLLLFVPPLIAGFLFVQRTEGNIGLRVVLTALIGAMAALLPLLIVFFAANTEIRDVLVNVNRDIVEILTFDNESVIMGGLLLLGAQAALGLFGGALHLLPQKIRNSLIAGLSITLLIGVLGDTIGTILEQFIPEDFIDFFLQRGELKPDGAIVIFIVVTVLALLWNFFGKRITDGYGTLPQRNRQMAGYGGYGALGVILLVLPWLVGTAFSEVLNNIGLFILMGLGLNIAIGLAGLLDLGYVTNFAVGAYVTAVLTSSGPLGIAEQTGGVVMFNFWLVIPIALLSAMFTGFIFAVPVLKMRGDYLAIATLGFGEIIGKLAISDWLKPIIGGAQGVLFIENPNFFGTEITSPEQFYYIILAACAVVLILSIRINNSRTGRQWMAIREDEDVAAAMGINVPRAKLLAFTLSAATGGLAGAIFAARLGTVFPNSFTVLVSINVLSLIIVGGMGSIPGTVVGAIVLIGMPEILREFSEFRWLLYGVLLVFMMLSRPEGLWPSQVRRREMYADEESPPVPAAGD